MECPYCGEVIKTGAVKCKFCKEFLNEEKVVYKQQNEYVKASRFSDSKGRMNRTNYTVYQSIAMGLYFIIYIISLNESPDPILSIISLCIMPFMVWIAVSSGVKRFHDINLSGWYYLLVLIPILGFIPWLILFIKQGDAGENRYGLPQK